MMSFTRNTLVRKEALLRIEKKVEFIFLIHLVLTVWMTKFVCARVCVRLVLVELCLLTVYISTLFESTLFDGRFSV